MITFSQKVFFLDHISSIVVSIPSSPGGQNWRYVNNISSYAAAVDLVVVSDLLMIKTKLRYCGNIE